MFPACRRPTLHRAAWRWAAAWLCAAASALASAAVPEASLSAAASGAAPGEAASTPDAAAGGSDVGTIVVYYNERPPYQRTDPATHEVSGLVASPVARAFRVAGMGLQWEEMPTTRQLYALRDPSIAACGIGWFRTPEREALFKYAGPVYQDRPTVALARAGFVPDGPRLAEVLRQPGLRVLVKDRYSYGPWIDRLLAEARPDRVITTEENVHMVRMIGGGRADLMFAAQEEAEYLVAQSGVARGAVRVLAFADVPPGDRRYLICSKAVPDEAIARLDRALAGEFRPRSP